MQLEGELFTSFAVQYCTVQDSTGNEKCSTGQFWAAPYCTVLYISDEILLEEIPRMPGLCSVHVHIIRSLIGAIELFLRDNTRHAKSEILYVCWIQFFCCVANWEWSL